ncbi:ThuA domain-containing protein [Hydrogenophaga sp.]|uniref:ThuA domain-containing protein n=1 Tax=Hydrogenophaga sp. TaxID=1904254 RepID=UPI00272856B6|nr:ThuA domain-containing protein [Hydrogenophaga sp.]MDO9436264.1 ThuA domain-containing protein [Hydrogenophaga sp.]
MSPNPLFTPSRASDDALPMAGSVHDLGCGAWRGTDPRIYNDWGAFASVPDRVLVYSRTAGPRHANLGPVLGPGLNPPLTDGNTVQHGLIRMLAAQGIETHWTEDVTTLASLLNDYKAVLFASTNRDTLWNAAATTGNDQARTALRQYMRRGGGFVGIHNAFGAEYNWPYYEGLLGHANFYNHGPRREGDVVVVADDPSTADVPARFTFEDEWYNLTPFPDHVKFLALVDTDTLSPLSGPPHPGHAGFHPVAWCHYYDGGRAWLTTLGHSARAFEEPQGDAGTAAFQRLLVQGVKSVMGLTPFCTPPAA